MWTLLGPRKECPDSERCPDFADFEMIHTSITLGQNKCPDYTRCPEFRISIFRDSTVSTSAQEIVDNFLVQVIALKLQLGTTLSRKG